MAALTLDGFLDMNWDPSMTGDYDGVWRVLVNGSQLYAGGEFTRVHGVNQQRIARFTSNSVVTLSPGSLNFGSQQVGTANGNNAALKRRKSRRLQVFEPADCSTLAGARPEIIF